MVPWGLHSEGRQALGPQVLQIQNPLPVLAEEAGNPLLQALSLGAQEVGHGVQGTGQGQEASLVLSPAVKEEEGEVLQTRQDQVRRVHAGRRRRGRAASMLRRLASSQGGRARCCPRLSRGSSRANPGPSVASSKRTPPGSRK